MTFRILSVPAAELVTECGERFPAPGSILDSRECDLLGEYAEEREPDVVLYLHPAYPWKTFKVKAE